MQHIAASTLTIILTELLASCDGAARERPGKSKLDITTDLPPSVQNSSCKSFQQTFIN